MKWLLLLTVFSFSAFGETAKSPFQGRLQWVFDACPNS